MSTPLKKNLCRGWRLYVITDCVSPKGVLPEKIVEEAILGGASVVQLRDKKATDLELIEVGKRLRKVTHAHGVPLIVNDRPEVAKAILADGVHLGQEDGSISKARAILGDQMILGRSTHSPEQALLAQNEGFDYLGVGPVFSTPTKPSYKPVGLELVRFAAKNIRIPFVAIGGIDATNAAEVRAAGAKTIAVVRAVMAAADPRKAAEALLK